jgi:nucleotide-binding universal stress UspA family protein
METTKTRTILIPWDFTRLSEASLEYASRVSMVTKDKIAMVHILNNGKSEEEVRNLMVPIAREAMEKYGIQPEIIVRKGHIYKTITDIASRELDTSLVIMKTDGPHGIQRYTGSRAIKIISGAKVPFIVIQEPPKREEILKIVSPVDFRTENKEKLNWILYLRKYYKNKILLYKPKVNDLGLKRNISNNIMFARQTLDKYNIDYEIHTAEGRTDFTTETIEFAHNSDADLILIMLSKYIGITDYLMGLKEQKTITNAYKIPVMCLNPRTDLRIYGTFQ